MNEIRFREKNEYQTIYVRNVTVAYPPEYLSVKEDREIIVSRIYNNGDNHKFEMQYNGATSILELASNVRDFPTIPEIEAFCAGVDAAYEKVFDFIPADLNSYSYQRLLCEFNDLYEVLKRINNKEKLYRNAYGQLDLKN